MMIRRFAMVLAVVLLALGVPVASAGAHPAPDPVCNTTSSPSAQAGTVEIDASVKLHHDLACELLVVAPRGGAITVDLNGYAVDAVLTGGVGRNRIVDGTVKGTVRVETNVVLRRVHVMGDVDRAISFPHVEIYDSTVDGFVFSEYAGAIVDHSVIGNGIILEDTGGTITHNVIRGGITISSIEFPDTGGLIADNTITGSAGAGIDVGDAANVISLTIRHNRINNNAGDGIAIYSCGIGVTGCVAGGRNTGATTIRGNQVVDNGEHGIEISLGANPFPGIVIDGGRNQATGNALDPQCVGVVCKP